MGISAPVSSTNAIFKATNPGNAKEYYLLENRQRASRDAALPDDGLAIWHVDEDGDHNANEMLARLALPRDARPGRRRLGPREQPPRATTPTSGRRPAFTANTPCTDPNTNWWNGTSSGLMFTNISASTSPMSFDFSPANEGPYASCQNYSYDADEDCCVTVNLANVDNGSYDPNGVGDIESFGITAVDGTPVALTDAGRDLRRRDAHRDDHDHGSLRPQRHLQRGCRSRERAAGRGLPVVLRHRRRRLLHHGRPRRHRRRHLRPGWRGRHRDLRHHRGGRHPHHPHRRDRALRTGDAHRHHHGDRLLRLQLLVRRGRRSHRQHAARDHGAPQPRRPLAAQPQDVRHRRDGRP